MWFMTGAVGLVSGAAIRMLIGRPWTPTEFEDIAGLRTAISYQRGNKGPATLHLGVVGDLPGPFRVRKEGGLDALGRFFGVVSELQTGDALFDDSFFLELDDPLLEAVFEHDVAARKAIFDVFYGGATAVKCARGVLWAEWTVSRDEARQSVVSRLIPQVRALHDLAGRIAGQQGTPWQRATHPASLWALAFNAMGTALLVAGGITAISQAGSDVPRSLAAPWIHEATFVFSAVGLTTLLVAAFLALRASSRLHGVLFELTITAGLGLWMLSWGEIYATNQEWDDKPAAERRVAITDCSHTTTTHKGSTTHHYNVTTAPVAPGGPPETFSVSADEFRSCMVGKDAVLMVHPGFFDVPWVESIRM